MAQPADPLVVGKITTVFGVKGWVKIYSFTEPADNLFSYRPWWIKSAQGWRVLEVEDSRSHHNGLVAKFKGVDDRDLARTLCQSDIHIEKALLPELQTGDHYWHQLLGLKVIAHYDGAEQVLGAVKEMMETGANDVLVVVGSGDSIDRRERLIPYVDQVVLEIDPSAGVIRVDWDPEF